MDSVLTALRMTIREHPVRRYDFCRVADGDSGDGLSGLVRHLERAVLKGHEASGPGARSLRKGAEVDFVLRHFRRYITLNG